MRRWKSKSNCKSQFNQTANTQTHTHTHPIDSIALVASNGTDQQNNQHKQLYKKDNNNKQTMAPVQNNKYCCVYECNLELGSGIQREFRSKQQNAYEWRCKHIAQYSIIFISVLFCGVLIKMECNPFYQRLYLQ